MRITTNYNTPSYKAKFVYSDDLKKVVNYAVETNRFTKLNNARKNIDSAYLTRRLKFEFVGNENGYPVVAFTRFTPKSGIIPKNINDYEQSEKFICISSKKMNPLKYGYDMIIKLSNSAPQNNLYKRIVAGTKN